MRRFLGIITAAAALTCSCAKQIETGTNENEKLYFDSWMQVHHPNAEKTGNGIYFINGNGDSEGNADAPVGDKPFVFAKYTAYDLDGNITDYTDIETARQMGVDETTLKTSYYGPKMLARGSGSMYAGLDEMLSRMNVGGTRTAVIPGWLMSYKRYGSEQEYIDNETGSNAIYKVTVVDTTSDTGRWQIDNPISQFISEAKGGKSGYTPAITKKDIQSLLSDNKINEIKDSTDMHGFYFIGIENGDPIEDKEEKDGSEEKDYSWSENHFPTDTTIYINYVGRLLSGLVFDTNIKRVAEDNYIYSSSKKYEPQAIQWGENYSSLKMGEGDNASSVVSGFAMTLWKMHPNGKSMGMFYSNLGYGASGSGNAIPAHSPLIFEIEIVANPDEKEDK